MADISIGRTSTSEQITGKSSVKSKYSELKKEYLAFLQKTKKSDFANSLTAKKAELELLSKLKSAAEEEGLKAEVSDIEAKEEAIKSSLKSQEQETVFAYAPIMSGKKTDSTQDLGKLIEACKNKQGEIDENTLKIIMAYKDVDFDQYHIQSLVQKCRNNSSSISDGIVSATEMLASAGIKAAVATQVIEEILNQNHEIDSVTDISLSGLVSDYKTLGFDDLDSFKIAKLAGKFDDSSVAQNSIKQLKSANIGTDCIIQVLNELATASEVKGKKHIVPSSVKSVVSIKKALSASRKNEKDEDNNPINKLGVVTYQFNDMIFVMKDSKIISCSSLNGESIKDLKLEYEDLISQLEDNVLLDFVKKYKDKNGEIDLKYVRTLTALRHNGIAYPQLMEMTDFCIDDGNINKNKLSAIGKLKSAGAIGKDIIPILSAMEKTPNGEYKEEDMKNASELTQAVLGKNEVIRLLPEVRNKENAKDFFVYFSQLLENKSNLIQLLSLVKDENWQYDENAMDVLYNIAQNFFVSENGAMSESDFMKNASAIISACKDKGETIVNDEGAGICSIMCQNKANAESILEALELCRTNDGKLDEQLAEILWDMSLEKASLPEIASVLNVCRDDNNTVLHNMTQHIISMFDSGADKDKVLDLTKKLNEI